VKLKAQKVVKNVDWKQNEKEKKKKRTNDTRICRTLKKLLVPTVCHT